jgi:hypothetical protein
MTARCARSRQTRDPLWGSRMSLGGSARKTPYAREGRLCRLSAGIGTLRVSRSAQREAVAIGDEMLVGAIAGVRPEPAPFLLVCEDLERRCACVLKGEAVGRRVRGDRRLPATGAPVDARHMLLE